jgi:hypothetical protein
VARNQTRINLALDALTQGLGVFVEEQLQASYGEEWLDAARSSFRNDRTNSLIQKTRPVAWDSQALLTVMWDQWNVAFRQRMGLLERSYVSELREYRNRWAHQTVFSHDDSYRMVDTSARLLAAIDPDMELVADLERIKLDILRDKMSEEIDAARRQAARSQSQIIDLLLYGLCAVAIVVTTFLGLVPRNPPLGYLLIAFVTFAFTYLGYKRAKPAQLIYGVHECPKCQKIIYSEVCPYCEAPPSSSSIVKGSSGLRLQEAHDVSKSALAREVLPTSLG